MTIVLLEKGTSCCRATKYAPLLSSSLCAEVVFFTPPSLSHCIVVVVTSSPSASTFPHYPTLVPSRTHHTRGITPSPLLQPKIFPSTSIPCTVDIIRNQEYLISDIPPSSSRVSNLQRHHCSHRHSTSTSVGATRVSNPNWNTCMFLTTAKDIWDAVHQTNSRALDAAQVYEIKAKTKATKHGNKTVTDKELSTLHETISIIQAKESKRSVMLEPQNMEGSAMVANKRLALLITK
ncbi:hypothetical protein AAG906_033745 [Vitis piasezkii]